MANIKTVERLSAGERAFLTSFLKAGGAQRCRAENTRTIHISRQRKT